METKKWFRWQRRKGMIVACAETYVNWSRTTIDEDDHFDFRTWFEDNHCAYGTWYIGGDLKVTTDKESVFSRFMLAVERYMKTEYDIDVKFLYSNREPSGRTEEIADVVLAPES